MRFRISIVESNGYGSTVPYVKDFFFQLPSLPPIREGSMGRKLVILNKGYIDILKLFRSGKDTNVFKIRHNSVVNSEHLLDRFIFQIKHKKNCRSNRTVYLVKFHKSA